MELFNFCTKWKKVFSRAVFRNADESRVIIRNGRGYGVYTFKYGKFKFIRDIDVRVLTRLSSMLVCMKEKK